MVSVPATFVGVSDFERGGCTADEEKTAAEANECGSEYQGNTGEGGNNGNGREVGGSNCGGLGEIEADMDGKGDNREEQQGQ